MIADYIFSLSLYLPPARRHPLLTLCKPFAISKVKLRRTLLCSNMGKKLTEIFLLFEIEDCVFIKCVFWGRILPDTIL